MLMLVLILLLAADGLIVDVGFDAVDGVDVAVPFVGADLDVGVVEIDVNEAVHVDVDAVGVVVDVKVDVELGVDVDGADGDVWIGAERCCCRCW